MQTDSILSSPADPLDEVSALTHPGSLLSPEGEIVAPYDLEVTDTPATGFLPLSTAPGILNANSETFSPDYASHRKLHVINGMGVTLGDSIIGLTALFALKKRHPQLDIALYRPARAPRYVQRLYELAAPALGNVIELPVALDALPQDDLKIDIGNHLFWPQFDVDADDRFLPHGRWASRPSTFRLTRSAITGSSRCRCRPGRAIEPATCSSARTQARRCAAFRHRCTAKWSCVFHDDFGVPVVGFAAVDHPHYTDITPLAPTRPTS